MPKGQEGKKKMKNKLSLIIGILSALIAVCFIFVGVFIGIREQKRKDESEFLWKYKWSAQGEDGKDRIQISFFENGEFSLGCDCGAHFVAYSTFAEYTYDGEKKTVTVAEKKGDKQSAIDVLYYDEWHLALQFEDDTVTVFNSEETGNPIDEPECAREYLSEVPLPVTVKEEKDGVLTLLPYDYDADAPLLFEGMVFQVKLSDDCEIASLFVTIDNGTESFEYEELSLEGAFVTEDNSMVSANLGFNEKGEACKVLIYGVTEIWG